MRSRPWVKLLRRVFIPPALPVERRHARLKARRLNHPKTMNGECPGGGP